MTTALLIEDNKPFRQAFKDGLRALWPALHIEEAADGDGARKILTHFYPDLIFMDIELPDEDGFTLTKAIKQLSPQTKVVILSAFMTSAYLVTAAEAGADCFILKGSLSLEEIGAMVQELMAL